MRISQYCACHHSKATYFAPNDAKERRESRIHQFKRKNTVPPIDKRMPIVYNSFLFVSNFRKDVLCPICYVQSTLTNCDDTQRPIHDFQIPVNNYTESRVPYSRQSESVTRNMIFHIMNSNTFFKNFDLIRVLVAKQRNLQF